MKKSLLVFILGALVFFSTNAQNYIGVWNYNSISGAPTTTNADIGNGSSSIIGSLVAASAATGMDPLINNGCGAQNGTNPGAWSFTANPGVSNESSGVQYLCSTVGFQNIRFTWDQRWSNTSTNTIRLQYTLDGVTWNNYTMTDLNTTYCNGSLNDGRFQNNGVGDQYRRISIDFASISAANNNANFGVRILAAHYQQTSEFRQTSNPLSIATAGTWRFDNVAFESSANVSIVSASNFQTVNENAGVINVPITVANAHSSPLTLTVGLSTYSDATENQDFTWTNTLTIPGNTNGVTQFPITIIDDVLAEKAERIVVKILNGTHSTISAANNFQIIYIRDNDYLAPSPTNELNLSLLSSFSNGVAGSNSAEIVAFDPLVDRLYIANSIGAKLDIVNFSNPSSPTLISSIPINAYGNINSVTAQDSVIVLAIENSDPQQNGKVVFLDYAGNYINQVDVGAMPDMITFNKDYTKILVANEGEPNATYSVDPVGSVSIIDLTAGYANLTNASVSTIDLTAFNGQENVLRSQGIRIFSTSASVAQDLEPEFIAISDDNSKAFVTMQENNAVLTIDLSTNTIVSLMALGYSSYGSGSGNAMDASDQSSSILITGNLPIKGAYMPDAIVSTTINGVEYLFTANEGDSREFGSVIDANRLSSSTFNNLLDPVVFPDQHILRNNRFLGRLSALRYSGDTDGDGDFDEIHVMGGRSFSIFNATTGALVFDSKDLIEQITANHPTFGAIFNASNSTGTPSLKNRSDDKGPEPEGITLHEFDGKLFAFIALERIGGVMIFNVNDPNNPVYVGYQNNRSTTASGPDLGAEGIITISAADSPNGQDLVILANEVSSTLSIYSMSTCAQISGATILASENIVCPNDTSYLSVNAVPNVSYQWLLDEVILPTQTNPNYDAVAAGAYKLVVNNSLLNCVDTSNVFTLDWFSLPNVSIGSDFNICGNEEISIVASGATNYVWNNGTLDSVIVEQAPNSTSLLTYSVIGTDSITGCSATDSALVQVFALPIIEAGNSVTACFGDSVTLTASGADTYVWSGSIQNGAAFLPSVGSAFYAVEGMDMNNCSSTDSVEVTIFNNPVAFAGNDSTYCANETPIILNGTSSDPLATFVWNQLDTLQQISVNVSGNYLLEVIDSNGCFGLDSVLVTVNDLPSVNIGADTAICPENLPLELVNLNAQPGDTYLWSSGETSSGIDVNNAGELNLIVTNSFGCTNVDSISVSIFDAPTVDAGTDTTICAYNFPLQINAINSASSTVVWNTGETTSSVEVSDAGTYIITATSNDGCVAVDSITISVDPCLGLSQEELVFELYPNPAKDVVHIQTHAFHNAKIEIISASGQLVYAADLMQEETEIATSQFSDGVYSVWFKSEHQHNYYRLVISK